VVSVNRVSVNRGGPKALELFASSLDAYVEELRRLPGDKTDEHDEHHEQEKHEILMEATLKEFKDQMEEWYTKLEKSLTRNLELIAASHKEGVTNLLYMVDDEVRAELERQRVQTNLNSN